MKWRELGLIQVGVGVIMIDIWVSKDLSIGILICKSQSNHLGSQAEQLES